MNDSKLNKNSFPDEVSAKLKNYVYRLIDPRNGETFYVGRGQGNRVFQHAAGITEGMSKEGLSDKSDRIREIKNAGLEVIHIVHKHGIHDDVVNHVEAALIDAYPGLTNEQGGEGSGSYGPMHADEIIRLYALPEMEENPEEKLVLINVNYISDRSSTEAIYKQVKGNWRIAVNRARKADYVIAVFRGVAIGVFKANVWRDSTEHEGRFCFDGEAADKNVWDKFVGTHGKRISNEAMKHIQYPIRYWKC
jgi:hypothetical protein